jgi:predicted PurR-regulated permease PerM
MPGPARPAHQRGAFSTGLALGAVVVLAITLWLLRTLVLVGFAAILVALLFRAAGRGVRRVLPVGHTASVLVGVVLILAALSGTMTLVGARTVTELSALSERLPEAVGQLEDWIRISEIESWAAERIQSPGAASTMLTGISGVTSGLFAAGTGVLLAVAGGLFLALDPGYYRKGAVALLPARFRRTGGDTLDAIAAALRAWLLGQLVAMLAVGILVAAGLWLLGIPTPLGLGVIAGLLEFVPYVGPVASAVPAVAVAFIESPRSALFVIALYVVVQQVEGTLLIPLIQRQAVNLPPAVTVFSVVAFGLVFGVAGFVLAAPLSVVALVLVQRLWIPYADGRPLTRPHG